MSYGHCDTIDPNLLADAVEQHIAAGSSVNRLCNAAKVWERTLYRVRQRSGSVSIDVADRLCMAMQIPLNDVAPIESTELLDREGYCRPCRDMVSIGADARCPWCDYQVKLFRRPTGGTLGIDPQLLAAAYQVYARGASIREVATLAHPRSTWANENSARVRLLEAFKGRGWKVRTRTEGRLLTLYERRGMPRPGTPEHRERRLALRRATGEIKDAPLCAAVAKRTGQPCQRHAIDGSDRCVVHDPARRQRNEAILADARSRRAS